MGELIKPVPTLRALCCTSQGGDIHIDKTVSGAPRGVRWSIVTNSLACPGKKFLFIWKCQKLPDQFVFSRGDEDNNMNLFWNQEEKKIDLG